VTGEPNPSAGPGRSRLPRRRAGLLAVLVLGLALTLPIEATGWNQTAHYALVRALDHGTTRIDRYRHSTGDKARYHGHWYSARAPGLAIWELPEYALLRAVRAARSTRVGPHHNDRIIWLLGLWGSVLPACALLLLVRVVAERLEPGFGTAAAVTVGVGSLLLPFATLLFSHVAAALLAFGAFAILFHERQRPRPRPLLIAAAGLFIGFGVTTEYPTLLVGLVLGLYGVSGNGALGRPRELLGRAAPYGLGVAVGVIPLALYNHWAFGSFTHVAYADIREQQSGFFGIGAPRPAVVAELLLSSRGLLILAPVLAMAVLANVLLYRAGRRAEALTIGAVLLIILLYDSGYYLPFGGSVPGPRFLVVALPFLGVPLATAWRRLPGPTLALAAASLVGMLIPTMTKPMVRTEAFTGVWTHWLRLGHLQATLATALGVKSAWVAWVPILALLAIAIALAARATPPLSLGAHQLVAGFAATCGWALFAALGPNALGIDQAAERLIVAAGYKRVTGQPYGSHPIAGLVLFCLGAALAALVLAAVVRALRTGPARVARRPRLRRLRTP
jgi:hypothetical protein